MAVEISQRIQELTKEWQVPTNPSGGSFDFYKQQRNNQVESLRQQLRNEGYIESDINDRTSSLYESRNKEAKGPKQSAIMREREKDPYGRREYAQIRAREEYEKAVKEEQANAPKIANQSQFEKDLAEAKANSTIESGSQFNQRQQQRQQIERYYQQLPQANRYSEISPQKELEMIYRNTSNQPTALQQARIVRDKELNKGAATQAVDYRERFIKESALRRGDEGKNYNLNNPISNMFSFSNIKSKVVRNINGRDIVSNNLGSSQEEDGFEKRVEKLKERDTNFFSSSGIKNIERTASYLTGGEGRPAENRGFVGKYSQLVVTGLIGSPFYAGGFFPSVGGKLSATGEGLIKNPKGVVKEYVRAGKETLEVSLNPTTPEGLSTYTFAILGGLSSKPTTRFKTTSSGFQSQSPSTKPTTIISKPSKIVDAQILSETIADNPVMRNRVQQSVNKPTNPINVIDVKNYNVKQAAQTAKGAATTIISKGITSDILPSSINVLSPLASVKTGTFGATEFALNTFGKRRATKAEISGSGKPKGYNPKQGFVTGDRTTRATQFSGQNIPSNYLQDISKPLRKNEPFNLIERPVEKLKSVKEYRQLQQPSIEYTSRIEILKPNQNPQSITIINQRGTEKKIISQGNQRLLKVTMASPPQNKLVGVKLEYQSGKKLFYSKQGELGSNINDALKPKPQKNLPAKDLNKDFFGTGGGTSGTLYLNEYGALLAPKQKTLKLFTKKVIQPKQQGFIQKLEKTIENKNILDNYLRSSPLESANYPELQTINEPKIKVFQQPKQQGGFRKGSPIEAIRRLYEKRQTDLQQQGFVVVGEPYSYDFTLPPQANAKTLSGALLPVVKLGDTKPSILKQKLARAIELQKQKNSQFLGNLEASKPINKIDAGTTYSNIFAIKPTNKLSIPPIFAIAQDTAIAQRQAIDSALAQDIAIKPIQDVAIDLGLQLEQNKVQTPKQDNVFRFITTNTPRTPNTPRNPPNDIFRQTPDVPRIPRTPRKTTTTENPPSIPIKIRLPTTNFFNNINEKPIAEQKQAYEVLIKRKLQKISKGKYSSRGYTKVNKVPLTKQAALGLGASIVDRFANQSFTIRKTKGKPQRNVELEYQSKLISKFRKSKNGIFVEKKAFAIDSEEERRQIPYEGQRVRKMSFISKSKRAFL